MNLFDGKLVEDLDRNNILHDLKVRILKTLNEERVSIERFIEACDELSKELSEEEYLPKLIKMGLDEERSRYELKCAKWMLTKKYLRERLYREFGSTAFDIEESFVPFGEKNNVTQKWRPLGVIFHIAAGNMEGLPAFSILEGLLTGNINLLKLSGDDDGLTIDILQKLIKKYPILARYIYIFDFPSTDIEALRNLAELANAVVVWGGDEAIRAVRRLSTPNTQIIEWGHKISFAYATVDGINDDALFALAKNICETEQLLCNSCQGIFIDTDSREVAEGFAKRFLTILNSTAANFAKRSYAPSFIAKSTLQVYTEKLMSKKNETTVFSTDNCSIEVFSDSKLNSSYMFRNCWVKMLPRENIVSALYPNKGYLQTVALLCTEEERPSLTHLLERAGASRIVGAKNMTAAYCGQPHDGKFALREYCRKVSIEI